VHVPDLLVFWIVVAEAGVEEEVILRGLHRHLAALQVDVLSDQRRPVVLCLGAALTRGLVLQVKKPGKGGVRKLAKSMTQEEWNDKLSEIIKLAHEAWIKSGHAASTFHKVRFMFDNPGFHGVDDTDVKRLLLKGYLQSEKQLCQPPRYSGDFMQCIEHVHAIICRIWWRKRLEMEDRGEWEQWERDLREIFMETITAEGVTNNCKKVIQLMEWLVENDTGGYAPLNLV
jgi:hypothetical protein